jgi:hypothetical protein
MVAWWPGDGNANDIVGSNHGTLMNGATFAAGKVGQAFSLDGVDDGISILKSSNLNMGAGDFSIDAWVKFTQTGSSFIFLNYAGVPYYGLQINDNRAGVIFRPGVAITVGANDPYVAADGTTSLNDGQWHHLVGVRSGATALIYVDGVLEGSATNALVLSVEGGSVNTGGCQYARIGATNTDTGHCTSQSVIQGHFPGLIDEVEIFNRALSAVEIQAIYNAGSAGKVKP